MSAITNQKPSPLFPYLIKSLEDNDEIKKYMIKDRYILLFLSPPADGYKELCCASGISDVKYHKIERHARIDKFFKGREVARRDEAEACDEEVDTFVTVGASDSVAVPLTSCSIAHYTEIYELDDDSNIVVHLHFNLVGGLIADDLGKLYYYAKRCYPDGKKTSIILTPKDLKNLLHNAGPVIDFINKTNEELHASIHSLHIKSCKMNEMLNTLSKKIFSASQVPFLKKLLEEYEGLCANHVKVIKDMDKICCATKPNQRVNLISSMPEQMRVLSMQRLLKKTPPQAAATATATEMATPTDAPVDMPKGPVEYELFIKITELQSSINSLLAMPQSGEVLTSLDSRKHELEFLSWRLCELPSSKDIEHNKSLLSDMKSKLSAIPSVKKALEDALLAGNCSELEKLHDYAPDVVSEEMVLTMLASVSNCEVFTKLLFLRFKKEQVKTTEFEQLKNVFIYLYENSVRYRRSICYLLKVHLTWDTDKFSALYFLATSVNCDADIGFFAMLLEHASPISVAAPVIVGETGINLLAILVSRTDVVPTYHNKVLSMVLNYSLLNNGGDLPELLQGNYTLYRELPVKVPLTSSCWRRKGAKKIIHSLPPSGSEFQKLINDIKLTRTVLDISRFSSFDTLFTGIRDVMAPEDLLGILMHTFAVISSQSCIRRRIICVNDGNVAVPRDYLSVVDAEDKLPLHLHLPENKRVVIYYYPGDNRVETMNEIKFMEKILKIARDIISFSVSKKELAKMTKEYLVQANKLLTKNLLLRTESDIIMARHHAMTAHLLLSLLHNLTSANLLIMVSALDQLVKSSTDERVRKRHAFYGTLLCDRIERSDLPERSQKILDDVSLRFNSTLNPAQSFTAPAPAPPLLPSKSKMSIPQQKQQKRVAKPGNRQLRS